MASVVTYVKYGATKVYFPAEHMEFQYRDEDDRAIRVVAGKKTLDALYGTEASGPRNLVIPKGKYRLVLAVKGVLHDLTSTEPDDGVARDGYAVKNDLIDFIAVKQHLESSKPTRINYPHWHGVNVHQEFEGFVTKFNLPDDAGIGSGLDFPSWEYYMEWEVGDAQNPLS